MSGVYFPPRTAIAAFVIHLARLTELHLHWLERASARICSIPRGVVNMHRPQAVRAMVGVSVAPNLPSTVITYEIFLAPLKFGGLHAIGHLSFFVHMVSRSDFPAVRASHGKARIGLCGSAIDFPEKPAR